MLTCNYIKKWIVNICLILAVGFFFIPTQAEARATPCYTFGDVNNDGDVTSTDATAVNTKVNNNDTQMNSYSNIRADVNDSNAVDVIDASLISQYSSGVISTFDICGTSRIKSS